jgi:quercetin dioxygenase-like cupin family protein
MSNDHFNLDEAQTPTSAGIFVDRSVIPPVEFVPGLKFQPTLGELTLANYVTFAPHTEAPLHAHLEEQVVIVVEGELEFTIDGQTRIMGVGDVAVIPPWVPHGAKTHQHGCREIDVFSPPRATLLDLARGTAEPAAT